MKTQVAIIGAGPSGLMLGHLLRQAGLDAVVIERHTADHVLSRIRAGVLEQVMVDRLDGLGLGERMHREGLAHDGFNLTDGERLIRIDMKGLTGKQVMVYGQTEVTRDLIDAAPGRGLEIVWEAEGVALHDIDSDAPYVT
jgi:p-hydroxybenzoate 3-monooxygenase